LLPAEVLAKDTGSDRRINHFAGGRSFGEGQGPTSTSPCRIERHRRRRPGQADEAPYAGSYEEMRRYALFGTQAAGKVDELKALTERCLGEYDLQGWTVAGLIKPGPTSVVVPK
jgi:hypothetical protein